MTQQATKMSIYYQTMTRQIESEGYVAPAQDPDLRHQEAWDLIKKANADIRIELNFDFYNLLCDRSDPLYEACQSRLYEDAAKIDDYTHRFYRSDAIVPMTHLPIGIFQNGFFYPGFGNHRSRAHEKAMGEGYSSKGAVMIVGENLSPLEQEKLVSALAAISNRETGMETTPEKEEDIEHQLQYHWSLEVRQDPSRDSWDPKAQAAWADAWIKERKPIYKQSNRQHRVTRMINNAFSDNIKQALPFPNAEERKKIWESIWPRSIWDPESSTIVKQVSHSGNLSALDLTVLRLWRSLTDTTKVRQKIWIYTTTEKSIEHLKVSSKTSVEESRATILKNLRANNLDPVFSEAGWPLYERVLFHHQLIGEPDVACEWNYQTEEFDKI